MGIFMRKYLTLLVPICLIGCSETETEQKTEAKAPVPAATMVVQPASQNETITAAGTVRLRRETELGFTTAGKVASVRYEEGDSVKRGAVLAALDTSTVSADLSAARAELERAESEYERMSSLFRDGWITKARLEQSDAATKSARARVQSARFASNTSHIHAPSGGIILARNVDAGQIVTAGQTVMVLGETGKGYVLRVPMTDKDASRVRVGMRANVTIKAVAEESMEAVISEKDGRADPRTGTFEVSFLLPGNGRLRSGQLGSVDIEVSRDNDGSISIPATALFGLRSGEGLVYVVDDKNRVKHRAVIINELTDDSIEVGSGLNEGDIVVTRGAEKLRDGDQIKPIRTAQ